MQQKRTPKAPIQIIDWSLAKEEREHIGEKIVFPANGAGSTGYLHTKKKKKFMNLDRLHTLHKIYLKIDHRTKVKMQKPATPR